MEPTTSIRCVIFDCDGTLIDSERLCLQAICLTLEEIDIHVSYQWLKEEWQGTKIDIIFSSILGMHCQIEEVNLTALITRYREHCNQLFAQELEPIDGVMEVIQELDKRNIAYCIASNAPLEKMDITLNLTKLMPYFENKIFSAFEVGSWKPEPTLLLTALNTLGFTPEQALFIDDSPVGAEAGVRAGIRTLYFTHQQTNTTSLAGTHTITHLKECLAHLI
ncbi:hypothetical protein BIY21_16630 [Vibrio ponticus]|uniref:HAD family hydrolase n=1 Tax=Vibrio ponticus TaxID=265668 RepID=A0ABX3FA52_9VIBR|nr:HAD-IA family hydrolase [Vibrio ponticus]OLQ87858.1 hypothetical protein BIY21_16630 [Vibrio ponticus]